MRETTYFLRFLHTEGDIEEMEFGTAEEAWDALRDYTEEDSTDIYSSITMTRYNWTEQKEVKVAELDFRA